MFEKRIIRTPSVSECLLKLIQENNMDEFDERLGKLEKAENAKTAKRKADEIA